jgi:hypothetical protein
MIKEAVPFQYRDSLFMLIPSCLITTPDDYVGIARRLVKWLIHTTICKTYHYIFAYYINGSNRTNFAQAYTSG